VARFESEYGFQRAGFVGAQPQGAQHGGQVHQQRGVARVGLHGALQQFTRARCVSGLQQVDGASVERQRVRGIFCVS